MEEKEYNDIESLAAYLHSGKMFSQLDHSDDGSGMPQNVQSAEKSVDDVLFTIDNIKKRPNIDAVRPKRRSVPDISAVIEDDGENDDYYEYEPVKKQRSDRRKRPERTLREETAAANTADDLSSVLGVAPPEPSKLRSSSTPSPDLNTEEMDLSEEEKAAEAAEAAIVYSETGDIAATRMMNAVSRPASNTSPGGVSTDTSEYAEVGEPEEEDEGMSVEDRRRLVRMRRSYERQKQRTRTFAYILLGVFLSLVIVGVSAYSSTFLVRWALDFTGIGSVDFKLDIQIPDDAQTDTVAAILAENNIITSPKFFKFYADIYDKYLIDPDESTDFISGNYTLSSTMQYSTILHTLRHESVEIKTVSVRIAEGMTAREIGQLLEENNVCFAEDFVQFYKNVQNNYDFERRVNESPLKFNQLEGYLFPDTYDFYVLKSMATRGKTSKNQTQEEAEAKMRKESVENAEAAAKKMYQNFNEKMTRYMYKQMGEMNMTLDEIIAVASLVQREAAYAEDMELVASVFLNRIRNSEQFPYLQSDISILYVENDIKPYIKGSQTSKEKIYNAYNTYVCKGVPAGPVCNPGLDAINAVLNAPYTNYFYFCANPETGDIYYAETHDEHIKNIELAGLVYDPDTDRYFEDDSRMD